MGILGYAGRALGALGILLGLAGAATAQPTAVVLFPGGGETLAVGSTRELRWANVPGTTVRILISRNGGGSFETLFPNTANDGEQLWTVTGPASEDCVIRIRSNDPEAEDFAVDSATFEIADTLNALQVLSPNGAEIWPAGSQQLIRWSAPGDGNVKIELSIDGGATYETIFGSTLNDGTQPWTVPDRQSITCRIRITHLNDASLVDESDEDFEIAPTVGIRVTTPSGGELWQIGTRREIRWEGTPEGSVRVELSRDGGASWETLEQNTPNDGSLEWQVVGPEATNCRIRVTRLQPYEGQILVGESPGAFGIVTAVTVFEVTKPNGGEILVAGTQQLITWNAPQGGSVRIELSRNAGVSWEVLFGSTPNDGAQLWTVAGPVSPNCLIRMTRTDDEDITDTSNATFFITATPGLTVTSPNGGEIWTLGSVQTIAWTGLEGGRVKIEISYDGGGSWESPPILANTPNDGVQTWVVTGIPAVEAMVRVSRLSPPLVSDTSDAFFEIDLAPLAVVAPKNGDEWVIGTQRLVQWSALPVGEIEVDLSRDGGQSWEPLFESTPNDGGQFWLVEGPPTDEAVIRMTALGDEPGFAFNDGVFKIVRGTIAVTSPNGGEQIAIGAHHLITWNTTTAGSVRIELSRNGGQTWETLFENTPNDGSEVWTSTGPPCTDCRIRIASWQDDELEDVSDGPFSLVCAPATGVIVPGQELGDSLNVTDCEAPHRPGSRGKLFLFSLDAPALVSIDVRSELFEGWLYLIDRNGNVLAEGSFIDSLDLPAGSYTIEVTSKTVGATGGFILRLQEFSVNLLSPAGGITWRLGEYQHVTWRSPAPGVTAEIRLIRGDGGGDGEPIAIGTPNDGVELWRVTPPATQRAVIRICIPQGNRGTKVCDQSAPFTLAPCSGNDSRACYTGPPGTSGVGECRSGTQRCGGDGILTPCEGDVLPQTELCGDGRDQDCSGADLGCRPCLPLGGCADQDACTTDACVDGQCRNSLPAPRALFECRATALDQALAAMLSVCNGEGKPSVRARHAKRLAKLLARVEKLTAKGDAARSRRLCVKKITAARRAAMKMRHLLDRVTARGIVCGAAASLIDPQLSGVGEAIIAVSSCDGKS